VFPSFDSVRERERERERERKRKRERRKENVLFMRGSTNLILKPFFFGME
jgi:hypothetical protein